jgi:hypothetical protein
MNGEELGEDPRLTIVVIRRRIHNPKEPPPGKKIKGCSKWRYQAIVTSVDWAAADIWRMYNDRGDCERVFKECRGSLGLGWLVSHKFQANQVAFLLRLVAYNVDKLFQRACEEGARREGRPVSGRGLAYRQVRWYRSMGRLVERGHQWVLRVSPSPSDRRLWQVFGVQGWAVP